jgi:hypothetical protein
MADAGFSQNYAGAVNRPENDPVSGELGPQNPIEGVPIALTCAVAIDPPLRSRS